MGISSATADLRAHALLADLVREQSETNRLLRQGAERDIRALAIAERSLAFIEAGIKSEPLAPVHLAGAERTPLPGTAKPRAVENWFLFANPNRYPLGRSGVDERVFREAAGENPAHVVVPGRFTGSIHPNDVVHIVGYGERYSDVPREVRAEIEAAAARSGQFPPGQLDTRGRFELYP